jgi:hypothetical protein
MLSIQPEDQLKVGLQVFLLPIDRNSTRRKTGSLIKKKKITKSLYPKPLIHFAQTLY